LLMRQVRHTTLNLRSDAKARQQSEHGNESTAKRALTPTQNGLLTAGDMRLQAWEWAIANKAADGSLPSGKTIAARYGRHERWGRLVKSAGVSGEFADRETS